MTTKFSLIWFSCLFFSFKILFTNILLYDGLKWHLTKAKTTKYQSYCHHIPLQLRLIILIKSPGIRGFFLNCKMNFNLSWCQKNLIWEIKGIVFKPLHLFSSENWRGLDGNYWDIYSYSLVKKDKSMKFHQNINQDVFYWCENFEVNDIICSFLVN